jgi:hypothetical protein
MVLTFFSRCINIGVVVNMSRVLTAVWLTFTPRMGFPVTDPVFQQAFETVRKSWSDEAWNALTPRQITDAIYREIRRIDAETAAPAATSATDPARHGR